MAWELIPEYIMELLTSLRFWLGLTMILAVVPPIWQWVSASIKRASETVVVGAPQGGGFSALSPLLEVVALMIVMMLPFLLMRWLSR